MITVKFEDSNDIPMNEMPENSFGIVSKGPSNVGELVYCSFNFDPLRFRFLERGTHGNDSYGKQFRVIPVDVEIIARRKS